MGWWSRLWGHQQRSIADLRGLSDGKVEIQGEVESIDLLDDPVAGQPCVAIEYRAWPPSTTIGVDGATAHAGRAFQLEARQAVDFILRDGDVRALIQTSHGDDIVALHEDLVGRYGVGLRAETSHVVPGAQVRVVGRVTHAAAQTSPHRAEPYLAVVAAERFWIV